MGVSSEPQDLKELILKDIHGDRSYRWLDLDSWINSFDRDNYRQLPHGFFAVRESFLHVKAVRQDGLPASSSMLLVYKSGV